MTNVPLLVEDYNLMLSVFSKIGVDSVTALAALGISVEVQEEAKGAGKITGNITVPEAVRNIALRCVDAAMLLSALERNRPNDLKIALGGIEQELADGSALGDFEAFERLLDNMAALAGVGLSRN